MLNWYDLPRYYDVSFSHEMQDELRFIKAVISKYCQNKIPKLLEPACGTGRLIVPLCKAGYDCTGFDINENTLQYLQEKLDRNKLRATLFKADMGNFSSKLKKFDLAYCTVDTFRHLLSKKQAEQHLIKVAKVLKKNGVYILGLHLIADKRISNKVTHWTARRGRLTVKSSMTMLKFSKKKREETLKVTLQSQTSKQTDSYTSIYKLRTYTLNQFYKMLDKTGVFEIINVYDENYDMNKSVELDVHSEYAVFLLKKIN